VSTHAVGVDDDDAAPRIGTVLTIATTLGIDRATACAPAAP
jgi:hypothetical protein